jgi:hypothetical protein
LNVYVELLLSQSGIACRYRETFYKSLPDLLAMTVYTTFCECFPDSFISQFNNNEFKQEICYTCYVWISGCRPKPKAFSHWNFEIIDPLKTIFTKEMANKKKQNSAFNIIEDLKKLGTHDNNTLKSSSNATITATSSFKSLRRSAITIESIQSIKKMQNANRFFKTFQQKPSHPIGYKFLKID